jgi:hypothetical protein
VIQKNSQTSFLLRGKILDSDGLMRKEKRKTSSISKVSAFTSTFLIIFAEKMQFSTLSKLNNEECLFLVIYILL